MRFYPMMKGDVDIPEDEPQNGFSWTDAGILAGAVLGILMGVSLLSVQASAVIGILILGYVIFKLFTTKA